MKKFLVLSLVLTVCGSVISCKSRSAGTREEMIITPSSPPPPASKPSPAR